MITISLANLLWIVFLSATSVVAIIGLLTFWERLDLYKEEKKLNKLGREQSALAPLSWSKENGFNRAPTLQEAERFAVGSEGDEVRNVVMHEGNLPE